MAVQIQLRNDTAANWTSANPVLAQGELGLETDTRYYKIGDGINNWSALSYGGINGTINQSVLVTTVNNKTANYTIVAGDANTVIASTGSAITITLANVLSVGQRIDFVQRGAGQITFAAGAGVTLNSADSKVLTAKQYAGATVLCVASGVYTLIGNLA